MAAEGKAWKEDGSLLFDIDRITYGLLKSGYLQLVDRWGRHYLRSAQLNPNEQQSWVYQSLQDPICGITITGAMSPIVFLVGDGKPCGDSTNGDTRTLYFQGCTPNTKAFVFDLMRDLGPGNGMQAWDASGRVSFTTNMPPLNIIAVVDAPPLNAAIDAAGNVYTPYAGGNNQSTGREWASTDFVQVKGSTTVAVSSGELAACLTFSRICSLRQGQDIDGAGLYLLNANEGCGGGNGSVRFFFSPAVATTADSSRGSFPNTLWYDLPRDRAPQALVIRASDYPFPFR